MNREELTKELLKIEVLNFLEKDNSEVLKYTEELKNKKINNFIEKIYDKINFKKSVLSDEINNIIFIHNHFDFGDYEDSRQKDEILSGFEKGLSVKEVTIYAKKEYSYEKMKLIKEALLSNTDINFIQNILKLNLSIYKMDMAIKDFNGHLPEDVISIYANNIYSDDASKEIRLAILNGVNQTNVLNKLARVEFDSNQIREIRIGLERGLFEEAIDLYAKRDYSSQKMRELREIIEREFKNGTMLNQNEIISFVTSKNFNYKQLKVIKNAIYYNSFDLDLSKIKKVAYEELSADILEILLDLLSRGIDLKIILDILDLKKDYDYYFNISINLKRNIYVEKVGGKNGLLY